MSGHGMSQLDKIMSRYYQWKGRQWSRQRSFRRWEEEIVIPFVVEAFLDVRSIDETGH